ncbi:TPA: hypothetical protein HA338_05475 [Methanosarcina acetivorans]|uniref:Uncharacterized protein n=1 Tax=Methanosarcina acetivorans TaxID=2214 RepID=A0A832SJN0_9EURY|nr:hypothetical protein [Methanosarcina acetivorans]HIH93495.1 hypothetical protein [Methanosarcina acetivorans]
MHGNDPTGRIYSEVLLVLNLILLCELVENLPCLFIFELPLDVRKPSGINQQPTVFVVESTV